MPAPSNRARGPKVVDLEGDDGTVSEEIVISVKLAVDVNFGPVPQLESARLVVRRKNVQIQNVSVERVHPVDVPCPDSHPAQTRDFHATHLGRVTTQGRARGRRP